MVSHRGIWRALDTLAQRRGLTASGLAVRAGLDPTAFNKSKRWARDGRPRWPSSESLAKVLTATGQTFEDFARLADEGEPKARSAVAVLGLAQAGQKGYFDDAGFPKGSGWEEIEFPAVRGEDVYALRVSGESMMPLYRPGDLVIVAPAATLHRGDRVVVKLSSGEVMAKELGQRSRERIELRSLNPDHPPLTVAAKDVTWIARILWASQ
ncbi:MAG: helix-turn-helix transcriptional regulator [Alphaproteobacteria bacterium]|nr:helix-turn-helix transcriptional regulator [Alphaproteobacteria bacterium]